MKWQACYDAAYSVALSGRFGRIERFLMWAAARAAQRQCPDTPECARAWKALAMLHDFADRCDQAEALYRRSLALFQRHLEPDHPEVLESLDLLMSFYDSLGRDREAALVGRTFNEAMAALRGEEVGMNHWEFRGDRNARKRARYMRRHFFPGRTVLLAHRFLPGPAGPFCLAAQYYHHRGWLDWALEIYESASEVERANLGADHPAILTILQGQSRALCESGREVEAAAVERSMVPVEEDLAKADRAMRSESPEARALALLRRGRQLERGEDHEGAAECYRRGLECEPGETETWYFLHNNLAFCEVQLKRFTEAEPLCRKAIAIDPKRSNGFKNLGLALQGQGRWTEAAEAFVESVLVCKAHDPRGIALLDRLLDEHPAVARELPGIRADLELCRAMRHELEEFWNRR